MGLSFWAHVAGVRHLRGQPEDDGAQDQGEDDGQGRDGQRSPPRHAPAASQEHGAAYQNEGGLLLADDAQRIGSISGVDERETSLS